MIRLLRELLARQNRLQRSRRFKVIASIVLVIGAIGAAAAYVVAATAPASGPKLAEALLQEPEADQPVVPESLPGKSKSAIEATLDRIDRIRNAKEDKVYVALGALAVLGLALIVVWLGVALTYLELWLIAWLVNFSLIAWHWIFPYASVDALQGLSRVLVGGVALAGAFTALIEGLRLLLGSLPGSVFAIARNTVIEAVRMKVSVIFIVLLIFGLAALPGMLNAESPLRYRVQSFLQYGTGGAFWIIAVLTLFFSAATVAFEQRDRQIWQTMTKPVASWEYLLGKWLGVVGVSATLLAVSTTGIFLFTEYLRTQPAIGEEARLAAGILAPSDDREILETQVLVARTSVSPDVPPEISHGGGQFQEALDRYLERVRVEDPDFAKDPAERQKVETDLYKGIIQAWRTIEPGAAEMYTFSGLERAVQTDAPVILRYRIDSGANAPDSMYTLTFRIQGEPWVIRETGLGHPHTMTVAPLIQVEHAGHWHAMLMDDPDFYNLLAQGVVRGDEFVLPPGAEFRDVRDIIEDGKLVIDVANRDQESGRPNLESITLPSGTFELTYVVGSYRANYLRAVIVLWLKLAFLSMLAIVCSTFLSFPVACLVAFGTFLAAESAGFLTGSLEYYSTLDSDGDVVLYKVVVRAISLGVAWLFRVYANLKPTTKLVDGELIPWSVVGAAIGVLTAWCAVLYGVGVAMFRRRELAMYSGQ